LREAGYVYKKYIPDMYIHTCRQHLWPGPKALEALAGSGKEPLPSADISASSWLDPETIKEKRINNYIHTYFL
jgi:hypothetical protein